MFVWYFSALPFWIQADKNNVVGVCDSPPVCRLSKLSVIRQRAGDAAAFVIQGYHLGFSIEAVICLDFMAEDITVKREGVFEFGLAYHFLLTDQRGVCWQEALSPSLFSVVFFFTFWFLNSFPAMKKIKSLMSLPSCWCQIKVILQPMWFNANLHQWGLLSLSWLCRF